MQESPPHLARKYTALPNKVGTLEHFVDTCKSTAVPLHFFIIFVRY